MKEKYQRMIIELGRAGIACIINYNIKGDFNNKGEVFGCLYPKGAQGNISFSYCSFNNPKEN
jgi:hypothetical protein